MHGRKNIKKTIKLAYMSGIILIFIYLLSNFSACDIRRNAEFFKVATLPVEHIKTVFFFLLLCSEQPVHILDTAPFFQFVELKPFYVF